MPEARPTAVLWDMDGTLYDFDYDTSLAYEDAARWAREAHPELGLQLTLASFKRAHQLAQERYGNCGAGPWEWRLKVIRTLLQLEGIEDDALTEELARQYGLRRGVEVRLYPGALQTLRALRRAKVPQAMLSNGNTDLERAGLGGFFLFCERPWHVNLEKPHPRIFRYCADLLGLSPSAVLYVGDSPHSDIVGARAAGMPVAWVNRFGARLPMGIPVPEYTVAEVTEVPPLLGLPPVKVKLPKVRRPEGLALEELPETGHVL